MLSSYHVAGAKAISCIHFPTPAPIFPPKASPRGEAVKNLRFLTDEVSPQTKNHPVRCLRTGCSLYLWAHAPFLQIHCCFSLCSSSRISASPLIILSRSSTYSLWAVPFLFGLPFRSGGMYFTSAPRLWQLQSSHPATGWSSPARLHIRSIPHCAYRSPACMHRDNPA